MEYAAMHVPEFPALTAAVHLQTGSTPVVVLDGVAPHERVISFCVRAKAAGLAHGMSKVQAEAACSAMFVARTPSHEEATFAHLCEIAEKYSPRVQAIASPANQYNGASQLAALLLMDCSGMGRLFGESERYARQLHSDLHASGFDASVAVAPNAEAAIMLSRSAAGVVVAGQATVMRELARLPVSFLPCEARLKTTLARWGIRTLGQLANLPDSALVSRLGQQGRRLQLLARGEAEHLLVPEEPAFRLQEMVSLDSPVELLDSLLFVISPLLEALMRQAMERAYALRSVQITLHLEKGAPHMVRVQPASPSQNRDALLKLLNLELQAKPPQAGIVGVALEAEASQPTRAQRGLFQAQFPEPDRLDLLLARLRAIAGEGNVGSPLLHNTHRDDAFTMSRFQPYETAETPENSSAHGLALRIFRPQQAARVVCWSEQPKFLFWRGSRRSIASSAGPWHSSGSWWEGYAWDHDLWDVVLTEPVQTLRLKHEHFTSSWAVVGVYD